MNKRTPLLAFTLGFLVSTAGNASAGLEIKAAAQVDCLPFPSVETLYNEITYVKGEMTTIRLVTCTVVEGQSIPAQSKFAGKLIAGPNPNTYSFVWDALQLPASRGLNQSTGIEDEIASSGFQGSDLIRITFKKGLRVGTASGQ